MRTTETYFFASPHPDYIVREGALVAPNQERFPTDAVVYVETESHFLEFGIAPKNVEQNQFVMNLVDCFPPLPEVDTAHTVIVEGDILRKNQEFNLIAVVPHGPSMATQAFKALHIFMETHG